MWEATQAAFDSIFVGPIWPASVLVLLVVGYLVLALLGAVDFDGPDLTLEGDGWESIGASTLRWFNLGTIPIILWAGCFAVFNWLVAYGLWYFYEATRYEPTLLNSALLATRNAVIAVFITKFVTKPLVPYLADSPTYSEETIIGQRCVISSGEATPTFGQAKFLTDGAPLLLNVRTDGPHLTKGSTAVIAAYDPTKRLYTVTADIPSPESQT